MKYTYISNVLATTKRTKGTLFALMIVGLSTLLFLACPEPDTDSNGDGTVTNLWKVTFDGGDSTETTTVDDGETVSKPTDPTNSTTPENVKVSKYVFYQWYTDKDALTTPFDFDTTITERITLYAGWQAEPVTITGLVSGKPEIADELFKDDTTITRVIIPDGVVKIGNGAFKNTNITSVIIPDGVTDIGNEAFEGSKLTEVVIPNSVITLGHSVFEGNNLTKVTISGGLETITGSTFKNNKLTEVVIPDSVTLIEANAFASNLLTKVTWGAKVKTIFQAAFAGNRLTELDIPSTVKQINTTAFYKNPLTTVTIRADDVKFVGNDAFSTDGTPTLTKVVMPKKLHDDLKAIKVGRLIEIFTFKGGTTKYVDITDGTTVLK